MLRKCIAALLIVCLIAPFTVFATDVYLVTNFELEKVYMELTIQRFSSTSVTATDAYYLLDTSANPTYVCVEFEHSDGIAGFGVIDLTDFSIPMYALDAVAPFNSADTVVYGGPLDFAVIDQTGETATLLSTGEQLNTENLFASDRGDIPFVTQAKKRTEVLRLQQTLTNTAGIYAVKPVPVEYLVAGGRDESIIFSSGANDGNFSTDCGINAIAIFLRHLDLHFNRAYPHQDEYSLKVALATISMSKFGIVNAIPMSKMAQLTNEYFNQYGSSIDTNVTLISPFTWSSFVNRINSGAGKPCILNIRSGSTPYWTKAHAVVAIGHTIGATATSGYIIVNSGMTNYGYVNIATSTPTQMIK